MTLTRRDKAAMRLAYECLRGSVVSNDADDFGYAVQALQCGTPDALAEEVSSFIRSTHDHDAHRRQRARLALLLRVLLRVSNARSKYDYGPRLTGWYCKKCGTKQNYPDRCPWEGQGPGSCKCDTGCKCLYGAKWVDRYAPIKPLWQIEPKREGV